MDGLIEAEEIVMGLLENHLEVVEVEVTGGIEAEAEGVTEDVAVVDSKTVDKKDMRSHHAAMAGPHQHNTQLQLQIYSKLLGSTSLNSSRSNQRHHKAITCNNPSSRNHFLSSPSFPSTHRHNNNSSSSSNNNTTSSSSNSLTHKPTNRRRLHGIWSHHRNSLAVASSTPLSLVNSNSKQAVFHSGRLLNHRRRRSSSKTQMCRIYYDILQHQGVDTEDHETRIGWVGR
jgi:hypothetical protein